MVYVCRPNAQKVEAGGSEVKGHHWLHNKFKASLGYIGPSLHKEINRVAIFLFYVLLQVTQVALPGLPFWMTPSL